MVAAGGGVSTGEAGEGCILPRSGAAAEQAEGGNGTCPGNAAEGKHHYRHGHRLNTASFGRGCLFHTASLFWSCLLYYLEVNVDCPHQAHISLL